MNPQFSAGMAEVHVRERLREAADARRAHAARLKRRRGRHDADDRTLVVAPAASPVTASRPAYDAGLTDGDLVVSVVPPPRPAYADAHAVQRELVSTGRRP